jgi:hypothetical protein
MCSALAISAICTGVLSFWRAKKVSALIPYFVFFGEHFKDL